MRSKQIRVSTAHYEALEERKGPGERFDDVLGRLHDGGRWLAPEDTARIGRPTQGVIRVWIDTD